MEPAPRRPGDAPSRRHRRQDGDADSQFHYSYAYLESMQSRAGLPVLYRQVSAKGLQAGFFRYLTKPIKSNEFMQTLDAALEFARQEAGHAK